jgi:hypothetical protein
MTTELMQKIKDEHRIGESINLWKEPLVLNVLYDKIEPHFDRIKLHSFVLSIGVNFECRDEDLPYAKNNALHLLNYRIYGDIGIKIREAVLKSMAGVNDKCQEILTNLLTEITNIED